MPYWRIYLAAVFKNWVVLVAGGVGILFTMVGLFVRPEMLRPFFFTLAVVALQSAAYRVWRAERQENEELARALEPRLEFEYEPGEKPFAEDTERNTPLVGKVATTRWIRVGVRNRSGTAVDHVSVVLEKCQPSDSQGVHLEHAFGPQGCPPGTAEFLVPAGGRVVVNLAGSTRVTSSPPPSSPSASDPLFLCYAAPVGNSLGNAQEYRLTLRAQSQGAPPAYCTFVIRPGFVQQSGDFQALPDRTPLPFSTIFSDTSS